MLAVFAVVLSLSAATLSYFITLNMIKKNPDYFEKIKNDNKKGEAVAAAATESAVPVSEDVAKAEDLNGDFRFYEVRLEDEILNVYASYEKHEEYLYGIRLNYSDLSGEDIKLLETGRIFCDMAELTEFTENFTS